MLELRILDETPQTVGSSSSVSGGRRYVWSARRRRTPEGPAMRDCLYHFCPGLLSLRPRLRLTNGASKQVIGLCG